MRAVNAMKASEPWYRQGWPWFLIGIPALTVVASIVTLWLAVKSSDGLVVDDYYQEGKAIEKTMERTNRAAQLGLAADLSLTAEGLSLRMNAGSAGDLPRSVVVTISHPTRAGMDQVLTLVGPDGVYAGALKPLASGRWQIQIEDEARSWRMIGTVHVPGEAVVHISSSGS